MHQQSNWTGQVTRLLLVTPGCKGQRVVFDLHLRISINQLLIVYAGNVSNNSNNI